IVALGEAGVAEHGDRAGGIAAGARGGGVDACGIVAEREYGIDINGGAAAASRVDARVAGPGGQDIVEADIDRALRRNDMRARGAGAVLARIDEGAGVPLETQVDAVEAGAEVNALLRLDARLEADGQILDHARIVDPVGIGIARRR